MEIIKAVTTVSLLFYIKSLAKIEKVAFQAKKKKSDPQIIQSGSSNTH